MKKFYLSACYIFFWSLLPIATLSAMERQGNKDHVPLTLGGQTEQDVTQTRDSFAFHQGLFRMHVERHKNLIHANAKSLREAFKEQLLNWLKELEYWKKEEVILRSDPNSSYLNLLQSLYALPEHYSLLTILVKSKDKETFEAILNDFIKNQWAEGTHFTKSTGHLNIYEAQKTALEIIKHNFHHLTIEYKAKLEKVGHYPELLKATRDLLRNVFAFGDQYKDFIDQLERERIDFVCLCQILFPATPEPIFEALNRVSSLVQEYEEALESCATSLSLSMAPTTELKENEDIDASTKDSTTPRTPKKVSLHDHPLTTTEMEPFPTPRHPSPRKEKNGFLSLFAFGGKKKSESGSHVLPLKTTPKNESSTTPKKMKRSSSSGALLGTPTAKRVDPLPLHPLPTPLPQLIPDSPSRKETKAPRNKSKPKPLDLSNLSKKDGGKISSPRSSPSKEKSKSTESPKDSANKKTNVSPKKTSIQ